MTRVMVLLLSFQGVRANVCFPSKSSHNDLTSIEQMIHALQIVNSHLPSKVRSSPNDARTSSEGSSVILDFLQQEGQVCTTSPPTLIQQQMLLRTKMREGGIVVLLRYIPTTRTSRQYLDGGWCSMKHTSAATNQY